MKKDIVKVEFTCVLCGKKEKGTEFDVRDKRRRIARYRCTRIGWLCPSCYKPFDKIYDMLLKIFNEDIKSQLKDVMIR